MGTTFKQADSSLFQITTPLGTDKLLLKGFRGTEGMSRLFRFELDMLSEDNSIDYTQIIGKSVTISIKQPDGTPRYFNGYISRFGQGGSENIFTSYHAEMVPWLWFLTRTADCKIFQNMTIPDIIIKVFKDLGYTDYSLKTQGTFNPRDYCVQYRETAFNFVSRLMEEYGIYYYFTHEDGKHTMVLGNDASGNVDCPGQNTFRFYIESTAVLDEDVVTGWHAEQELRTGKCTLSDYNFETPSTSLLSTTSTIDSVGGNSKFETFDYPGEYLKKADGDALVKVRMEEEESVHLVIHGTSDARSMVSGCKFTLKEHYRDDMNDISYLLSDVEHIATTTSYGNSRGAQQDHYSNSFRCIPASVPFRPLRLTPHPTVAGPQTALVVGPSGEEIYVDKYGRIKVQFYWDRQGKKDENTTCWIRVAQIWAGKQWGAIFHPRIGQEVVVDFLEGDPDQPLITGRVYNAEEMPPYTLPDNMTQSGILTRSSKSGTADNFNELRFEDKKGSEEVYFHAEKDMNVVVENNLSLKVGLDKKDDGDRTEEIYNNDTLKVGNNQSKDGSRTHTIYNNDSLTITNGNRTVEVKTGNETHTIDQGDETLTVKTGNRVVSVNTGNDTHTVKTGNRTVEVATGNDSHTVKMGNRTVEVSMGNDALTVKLGNQTTKVNLGAASTEAMQGITLKVGANSIKIDQMGITIDGMMIKINGQVQTQVQGLMTQVSGSAMLQCSGGITMIG